MDMICIGTADSFGFSPQDNLGFFMFFFSLAGERIFLFIFIEFGLVFLSANSDSAPPANSLV